MPVLVDLINQIQKVLPVRHGGTGSELGYASERLILAYMNDTGAAIARGTLVKLKAVYDDTRVIATTAVGDLPVGVVVGRYYTSGEKLGEFENADPAHQETVAVCVAGRCSVLVAAAVTVGQFASASATAGKAQGSAVPTIGTIGRFESSTAGVGTAAIVLTGAASAFPQQHYTINFLISGGGSIPEAGIQGNVSIDAPGTIISARLLATTSGSAVVNILKSTYAGFPTMTTICSGTKPTLSAAQKYEDTTLSSWTTALAAGDVLRFDLDSIATITSVTCALKVRRT